MTQVTKADCAALGATRARRVSRVAAFPANDADWFPDERIASRLDAMLADMTHGSDIAVERQVVTGVVVLQIVGALAALLHFMG